jgi:hypothetical protein
MGCSSCGSVVPTSQDLEDLLLQIVEYSVTEGAGILRADQELLEPSKRILPHMLHADEMLLVAKDVIRQVLFLNQQSCLFWVMQSLVPTQSFPNPEPYANFSRRSRGC